MNRSIFLGATVALFLGAHVSALAQSPPAPAGADQVAATVNGEDILGSDIAMMFDSLPEQYRQFPLEMLYKQLLEQLVNQKLVAAAARKEGILDDPKTKRRIAFLTESLLQQIYMERLIREKVTEAALRAAYDKRKTGATRGEEIHARHILVKTEAEALVIIKQLQDGADFAEVASEKSIGPSKRQGGDLGFFQYGQMVPPFSEAAFKMKPGEISSEPVQTQFGWHIIKVEERREAGMPSFEDSVDDLRNEMIDELVKETMTRLRANADVKIMQGGEIQRVQ